MNVVKQVLRFLHRGLRESGLIALHVPSLADCREYVSGGAVQSRPAALLISVGRQVSGGRLSSAEEETWNRLVAQLTGRGPQDG
jgi:hypothetical protein